MRRLAAMAAGVVFLVPLAGGWTGSAISTAGIALLAAIGISALVAPRAGLLLMAAVFPLAPAAAVFAHSPHIEEQLVLTYLVAACARETWHPYRGGSRLWRPALVLAALIGVSVLLQLSDWQLRTTAPGPFAEMTWRHLTTSYYDANGMLTILHSACAWIAALALAVMTERLVRRYPGVLAPMVLLLLVSGGAVGAFSVKHLLELVLASPSPAAALLSRLRRGRFNPFYIDINAAASFYALNLTGLIWLLWRGRRRWAWIPIVALAFALWLAGSRSATAATVIVSTAAWLAVARPQRWATRSLAALGVLLVMGLLATSVRNSSVEASALVRVELTRVGLHLVAEHPVVGNGLDTFRSHSVSLIDPPLRRRYPRFFGEGENAHNNFLQILAELGAIGLTAFLVMVVPVLRGGWRARNDETRAVALALPLALAAFLVTCLFGHPLLMEHIRAVFFLAVGAGTAGLAAATPPMPRAARWLLAAALAIVALSAPFRLQAARRAADLSGIVLGAAEPEDEGDGTVYRLVETDATWFVSSEARAIELPLRAAPGGPATCPVHITIDDRAADDARPTRDGWTRLVFQFSTPGAQAARRVRVQVAAQGCAVMVGSLVEHQ
jgi:O-antigen ligase